MEKLPMRQELVAVPFRAGRGVQPHKAAPVMNDDDIASRIHRELMEKDPDNLSLHKADVWKIIRKAVRRWRQGQGAETKSEITLFRVLDGARGRGVIR